jgi:spermidine/putrescine-binding protein
MELSNKICSEKGKEELFTYMQYLNNNNNDDDDDDDNNNNNNNIVQKTSDMASHVINVRNTSYSFFSVH